MRTGRLGAEALVELGNSRIARCARVIRVGPAAWIVDVRKGLRRRALSRTTLCRVVSGRSRARKFRTRSAAAKQARRCGYSICS